MRNLPVWGKIALGLSAASAITLAIAAVGYFGILATERALTSTIQTRLPTQAELAVLRNALTAIQRAERTLLIPETAENPAELERQRGQLAAHWAQAETALAAGDARYAHGPLAKEWKAFREALEEWRGRHKRVLELLAADMRFGAMALSMREARESLDNVEAALAALQARERAESRDFAARALPQARRERLTLLLAAALAVLSSLGFCAHVTRNINRPLRKTLAFAQRVAAGDLAAELRIDRRDEIGRMAEALRAMVQALQKEIALAGERGEEAAAEAERARSAVEEARQAGLRAELSRREGMRSAADRLDAVVERLGSASEELSAQVEQSARGAEDQSRLAGSTAQAMDRLLAAVAGADTGAARAAETAETARQRAEQGARTVARAASGIAAVQGRAEALRRGMDALRARSEAIGRIITVIDDIADQTNLLALNAAIEAARAGDAGRGFAVVADEVRKLAEKTQAATKEVGEAIRGIQGETRASLDQVDQAGQAVNEATAQAETSARALGEIVGLAARTAEAIRAIAGAPRQQSADGQEVNAAVADMRRISEETSRAMDESAQAVSGLAEQARRLAGLVQDIRDDADHHGEEPRNGGEYMAAA